MSLALTEEGRQSLTINNVPETDYIVLKTINNMKKDERGLVSDTAYRSKIIQTLDSDIADATTDKLIKRGLIIGYKEAGGGIGVI